MAAAILGSKAAGSIVKIKENGKPVEFYVAKHDYESARNGAGHTLVVRKDYYDSRQWHTSNVNAYATSDIDTWLNGTYKNLIDAEIRTRIGATEFPYTPGNGNKTVSELSRSVFLLSATEYGLSNTAVNVEGSALPIASKLRDGYINGTAISQWTRSRS